MTAPEASFYGAVAAESGATNEELVELANTIPFFLRPSFWAAVRACDAGDWLPTPRGLAASAERIETEVIRFLSKSRTVGS